MSRVSRISHHKTLGILVALLCIAIAGCSPGDSKHSQEHRTPTPPDTLPSTNTGTATDPAAACLLSLDDAKALPSPLPTGFDVIESASFSNFLRCSYIGTDALTIEQVEYSGTFDYGDGSPYTGPGATCANGSPLSDSVALTDVASVRKQLQSEIVCATEPVSYRPGHPQGDEGHAEVEAMIFPQIGEGMYCIIPSNCFLLTKHKMYVFGLTKSETSRSYDRASTYADFGGYKGSQALAKVILTKLGE